MDGGTKDLDNDQQVMYGKMLLPQSSHTDPTAGRDQQMTNGDDDDDLTPQRAPHTQTTQKGSGNEPSN
eukprot:650129-Heterocapsa_arctica.AAC.1